MKKNYLLALAIAAALPAGAQQVLEDNYTHLRIHYDVPSATFDAAELLGEKMLRPTLPGYTLGGEAGSPSVPFLSNMLTVPFCDGLELIVTNATYDTVDLPPLPAMPQQPPRSKSDTTAPTLVRDKEVYATNAYSGLPLAAVTPLGVARDRNLALLRFAPVRINPVSGKAIVCRSADISIRYRNADRQATEAHYARYHTPSFSAGTTLNSLGLSSKAGNTPPVRMSILAPASLDCRRLHAFADWKRRQGMMVDIITTERSGTGASNELKNALQALYDNASATEPAPTFVVVIGDHPQLPAFNNQLPNNYITSAYSMHDHITDLYFTTWTDGDYLPDAYYGRLSATDTVTLARILNKTIYYESYSFDDDSFLDRAVLVSGVDRGSVGDNAYSYADPTMDYAASQYVNAANGFSNVRYYKNRTAYAPTGVTVNGSNASAGIADTLRAIYDQGIGWINYSAHGDWDEWSIPQFNVDNANVMMNSGKPGIMIGNCCLSNKFNKDICLGEALLRHPDNGGAAAYIGASQETYWTHDFFWAVGLRGGNEFSGTSVAPYKASGLGMYDRLFHTHNEAFDQHAPTMGSMMYWGNMAVQAYSGDATAEIFAQYYWEIYHVMGDPSLMPWLGRAKNMPFSADTSSATVFRFTTAPNAYVAIVDSATLKVLGCTYADATGYGEITPSASLSHCFFTANAQGYKPYISNIDNVDLGLNISVRAYPNPATDKLSIVGSGISEVTLATISGRVVATYSVGADYYSLDLSGVQPGLYLIVVASDDGITAERIVVK